VAKGVLVVQTRPVEGREDDYNKWYDEVHLPEIVALAGFTSARRFKLKHGDADPYLALYEVEAEDVTAAQAALGEAMAAGKINMTDALAMDPPPSMSLWEQISECDS